MTKSRAEQAAALEVWAENVEFEDLKEAETGSLRAIAKVVDQRNAVAQEPRRQPRLARRDRNHARREQASRSAEVRTDVSCVLGPPGEGCARLGLADAGRHPAGC